MRQEKGEPMYKPPIELLCQEMETRIENEIFTAIQNVGVFVYKEELIRALQYDRNQYDKGYQDAVESIVSCHECKHWWKANELCVHPKCCEGCVAVVEAPADHYCGYGERKTDG